HARVSAWSFAPGPARRRSIRACVMTAKANARPGVSARRKRAARSASTGSRENNARASGSNVGPACACILRARAAKPDTPARRYQTQTQEGSTAVESEQRAAAPGGPLEQLTPAAEVGPAIVLNDPAALKARLETYGESRHILVDWLLSQLVAGIDYTLIH